MIQKHLSTKGQEEYMFYQECNSIFNNNPHPDFLLETVNSFRSIVDDLVSTIHDKLGDDYEGIRDNLNNQSIKYVAFAKMYEEGLIKVSGGKIYTTYEYPNFKTLPKYTNLTKYLSRINKINIEKENISHEIDDIILDFAKDLIGTSRGLDPKDPRGFEELCLKEMRGREKLVKVKKSNAKQVLHEAFYMGYPDGKVARKNLSDFKKDMDQSYRDLQSIIDKSVYLKKERRELPASLKYFDISVDVSDYELTTANHNIMEIHRLYSSLGTLYNIAYKTKMDIMNERCNLSRDYIKTLMEDRSITSIYGKHIATEMKRLEKK